ncbi:hypothetical protein IWQ60_008910 [Tieghemiomyces parasiticus]|uniref:Zn(2)-C6 fungal-type domain-containing protein n=1 Tax=Tieghemiomyces parasiticus TaxID=78921 RepID=A0A9W8DKS6_9FUNG|nr:hypothetical protein IWQ60_008910 [Tieghemiomyces parasiticus]
MEEDNRPLLTRRSCNSCLKRKIRCDSGHPCKRCGSRNEPCVYGTITRRPPRSTDRRRRADIAQLKAQSSGGKEASRSTAGPGPRLVSRPLPVATSAPWVLPGMPLGDDSQDGRSAKDPTRPSTSPAADSEGNCSDAFSSSSADSGSPTDRSETDLYSLPNDNATLSLTAASPLTASALQLNSLFEVLTLQNSTIVQESAVSQTLERLRVELGLPDGAHSSSHSDLPGLVPLATRAAIQHNPAVLTNLMGEYTHRPILQQALYMAGRPALLQQQPLRAPLSVEETLYNPRTVYKLSSLYVSMCYGPDAAFMFPRFIARLRQNRVDPLLLNCILTLAAPMDSEPSDIPSPDDPGKAPGPSPATLYYFERARYLILNNTDTSSEALSNLTGGSLLFFQYNDLYAMGDVMDKTMRHTTEAGYHQIDRPRAPGEPAPFAHLDPTAATLATHIQRQVFWTVYCGQSLVNLGLGLKPGLDWDVICAEPPDEDLLRASYRIDGTDPNPTLPFQHFDFFFGRPSGIALFRLVNELNRLRHGQTLGNPVRRSDLAALNQAIDEWSTNLPLSDTLHTLVTRYRQIPSNPPQEVRQLVSMHSTYILLLTFLNTPSPSATPECADPLRLPECRQANWVAAETMTRFIIPITDQMDFMYRCRHTFAHYFGPAHVYLHTYTHGPVHLRRYCLDRARDYLARMELCVDYYPVANVPCEVLRTLIDRAVATTASPGYLPRSLPGLSLTSSPGAQMAATDAIARGVSGSSDSAQSMYTPPHSKFIPTVATPPSRPSPQQAFVNADQDQSRTVSLEKEVPGQSATLNLSPMYPATPPPTTPPHSLSPGQPTTTSHRSSCSAASLSPNLGTPSSIPGDHVDDGVDEGRYQDEQTGKTAGGRPGGDYHVTYYLTVGQMLINEQQQQETWQHRQTASPPPPSP